MPPYLEVTRCHIQTPKKGKFNIIFKKKTQRVPMASLSHSPLFRLKLLRRSTTPPSTSDRRHDGMGFAAPFKNVRRLGRRKGNPCASPDPIRRSMEQIKKENKKKRKTEEKRGNNQIFPFQIFVLPFLFTGARS
ncbi:hypothetical protein ES332_D02G170100v1 [Gossypium tomentosum]|uniref:Uncharacterized protein n=1 Tax=Gossypium tomentosum TaxID=34277 RepID=A0A5D2LY92_GOSTO|nr:hypothetical protein ES332_D02G170100v1 [Gossypium tomentosum]